MAKKNSKLKKPVRKRRRKAKRAGYELPPDTIIRDGWSCSPKGGACMHGGWADKEESREDQS